MKKHSDKNTKTIEVAATVTMVAPGGASSVEKSQKAEAEGQQPGTLSPAEIDKLERVVDEGQAKALEARLALATIKANGHYAPKTFHAYCEERFGYSKSFCYECVQAARVYRLLQSEASDCLPTNEAQIRPLISVRDDRQVIEIWAKVVQRGADGITEPVVRKIRDTIIKRRVKKRNLKKESSKVQDAIQKTWKVLPDEEKRGFADQLVVLIKGFYNELGGAVASTLRGADDVEMILPGTWPVGQVNAWLADHKIGDADFIAKLETHPDQQPWHIILTHEANPSSVAEPPKQANKTPTILEAGPEPREVDELASRPRPDQNDTLSRRNFGQTREKAAEPEVTVNNRPSKGRNNGHRVKTNTTLVAGVPQPGLKSRRVFAIMWHEVNWRLSNVDLADIWEIKPFTVRMMRHRKQHGPAGKSNTEVYAKAMEAEKVKAKAFQESYLTINT
jgi:hypothetical protein